jgi:alpha-L-arabinofuranosidase
VLVYPEDNVGGFDPDVIAMLKDAKLPLLRWPGGNFVSGYRWRDGIGPADARPTLPNPSWDGLEYNLMGTDEFVAYCRVIGCEPMICVNGGDGTPEEAAAWIEYCNGPAESPMGKLRAANGHKDPYNIKLWEVGNELYGRWQVNWTSPGGNSDRYLRFAEAMRAADPSIYLLGCGSPDGPNSEWNRRLLEDASKKLTCITDHILAGGRVNDKTDMADLYQAFLGYSVDLGRAYRAQRDLMITAGIKDPKLAITELQVFARPAADLSAEMAAKIPRPQCVAEALYFSTIFNETVRLGGFVDMITHSATVNHGGGLRKTRERVFGNPVHYAHVMYAPFANAKPIPVKVTSATQSTRGDYARIAPQKDVPVVDALAARSSDGKSLLVMLLSRSATVGPIDMALDLGEIKCGGEAEVVQLGGATYLDQNTFDKPQKIVPQRTVIAVDGSRIGIKLNPFTLLRVAIPLR